MNPGSEEQEFLSSSQHLLGIVAPYEFALIMFRINFML